MEIFKTITEGGQIWVHRVRLAKQVLKIASSISLCFVALFFSVRLIQVPFFHYQATGYYLKASILKYSSKPMLYHHRL